MISLKTRALFLIFLLQSSFGLAEVPTCYQGELNIFFGYANSNYDILYDHLLTNGQIVKKNEYLGLYTLLVGESNLETFEIPYLTTKFKKMSADYLFLTICSSGLYPSIDIPNHHYTPVVPKKPKGWQPGYNIK